jgi:soluble lytic murein transglycosylase-like protein
MQWFASQRALEALEVRLAKLEVDWKAQLAALENAADLYNRAASRRERSHRQVQKLLHDTDVAPGGASLDEIRRRRGGF